MKRLTLLLLAVALVALPACRTTGNTRAKSQQLQVTQPDNGKALNMKPGQPVEVTLRGNPSTGYEWILTKETSATPAVNSGVTQVGETKFTQDREVPGSPGTVVMTFKVGGSTTLSLDYLRSWEKNVPPTKSFKVKLVLQ